MVLDGTGWMALGFRDPSMPQSQHSCLLNHIHCILAGIQDCSNNSTFLPVDADSSCYQSAPGFLPFSECHAHVATATCWVHCADVLYDDARLCTLLLADASNVYEHGIIATPLSGGGAEEGGAEEGGAEEGGAEEGGAEEGGAEEGGAEEGGTGEGGKQPAFLL